MGQAIKKKTADETYLAFKNIFESSGRVCVKLHMDGGNEFKGACRKYLESLNIKLFIMEGDLKAMFVERFNQTLKSMMWREFTFNNDPKYSKQLQDLVSNYNNSKHRAIKTTPASVTKQNEEEIFKTQYGFSKNSGLFESISFKYSIGDYVRLVVPEKLFQKGYTAKWTDEIFIIDHQIPTHPPTYKIRALNGEFYEQKFYTEELIKINHSQFPIDAFEVIDEDNENIKIKQLNTAEDSSPKWVQKKQFLQ